MFSAKESRNFSGIEDIPKIIDAIPKIETLKNPDFL